MGPPRDSHVQRTCTHSLIAKWLSGIATNASRLIRVKENRQHLMQSISKYAKDAGAAWGRTFDQHDYQRMQRGVSATRLERDTLHNVHQLAHLLNLSPVEAEVLALAVMLRCDGEFAAIIDDLDGRSNFQVLSLLQAMLRCSQDDVRKTCAENGTLSRSHLLVFQSEYFQFNDRLKLADGLAEVLGGPRTTLGAILDSLFEESPRATLTRLDYGHMSAEVSLLIGYLRGALRERRIGVNALLVGIPGTGKTELARLVAAELNCVAADVKAIGRNREPASPQDRLASYSLAQAFLASSNRHLVIFDEMEDLFAENFGHRAGRPFGKRFINECLETNPVPCIWIANSTDATEASFLRRFDIAIRFDTLPRQARASVIARHLGNIQLNDVQRATLLNREHLLPSQVSMAAKVANTIGDRDNAGAIVVQVIDNSMALLGQNVEPRRTADFDSLLVNADTCLTSLMAGLRSKSEARICMTGPPGTGKTAFAQHLATHLDIGLLSAKVSDLFSPYLGATEQRIANVFRVAAVEGKVLLFDEADSLFSRRKHADQLWQVTLVNEMLMQLDDFRGIVCFTTNQLHSFDDAVLRRFDFKVTFGYPSQLQRRLLFERSCPNEKLDDAGHVRLARLTQLTPGDFAAVRRKHRIVGNTWTVHDWLSALEAEHLFKSAVRQNIGFVSNP